MATIAKTIVATGATSGLGFELVKQLLAQTQPYKFILGARDTKTAQATFDRLEYDNSKHSLTIFPLELSNLKTVKTFSQQALDKVGQDKIDYLMLNAAISKNSEQPGPHGSKWSEPYIVNHLSQHYLIHLLREKLEASKSRIVVISSGAVCLVKDPKFLEHDLTGGSKTDRSVYGATKFVQLLGAHWWRRQLQGKCHVVAVSPGLVPGTGLIRGSDQFKLPINHPDAKSVPEGAQSMYRAFIRDDFPEDPDQIFLTSWGEWWPKDVYGLTLDKDLQDKWSPSKDEIEKEEGLTA
ncbi:putative short-chain dehydrogenase reductase protein [Daldinia childiae]|uniref:putative short-chain dehydrogenase reductase protein n=1 Tax=Daldinia childiae TaxID=326645 RepID=UPI001446EF4A|nr:putative short-chain dehydrogenase reductase protein [Daldinia childiae]KAF3071014.1 putative short-chain dehydrogenase reductase protein [Daldinia childiae]